MSDKPIQIIPFLVFVILVVYLLSRRQPRRVDPETKRMDDLAMLAKKLGLSFASGSDFKLAEHFSFFAWLNRGEARCASHVFHGFYQEYPVKVFDYFFATPGGKQGCSYYWSAYIMELKADFPDTLVSHKTFEMRFLETMGESHTTFESEEFTRAFNVRSADKKFAFDVCNANMMNYLLANRDLILEIHGGGILLLFQDWLRPEKVEANLSRLVDIRKLLPDYLFTNP
jgi:hypothetical protein